MKKRVRVYKPGGQTNQPNQEQIVDYISQRMSADDFDGDTDSLKAELSQAGIEDAMADDYISYVSDNLGLEDNAQLDEETQAAAEQEQANSDEEQALLEEQQATEDQARKQQQEAMYNVEINPEDTEDTPEDEDTYMRQGGTNLSKRSFIKQYTKFAKMAQGGDTPSPGSNDVLNGRESHVKGFLGAVRNTANDAVLKQEAENEYNSAYGAPQVGAFQEGGIHQEEIDPENPLHHLSTYGTDTRHIFSDDMYTQNDVAAMEQFGGNTGQGLYKFIGGGDNESADEQYQDSDIDFNQEQFARGGVPRRLSNRDLTARGYYSESGQKIAAPNTQGKAVTSVEYLNKNIFGMPRQVKYNYGPGSPQPTAPAVNTPAPGEYTGPDEFTGRRQPLANFMMRTGIPGVRDLGAKMIKSGPAPVVPNVIPETFGNQKYDSQGNPRINTIPETEGTQRRDSQGYPIINKTAETFGTERYDFKNNAITQPTPEKKYDQASLLKYVNPSIMNNIAQMETAKAIQDLQSQSRTMRKNGGPIDYTEYAYGGDVSVPELYKAQLGAQTNAFDPNANPLGTTKDYKGDTVDFTGKVIKKRDSNFSFGEDATKLKNPFAMNSNSKNPLTGEKAGVIMNSEGAYTNDGLVDEAAKKEDGSYSQLFDVNRKGGKGKLISNIGQGIGMGINVGLDALDKINARKQENQLLANVTSAESNYGISNADNRGYGDPNSGDIDPSRTGQMRSKYGGGIYAMGGNTMDEDEDVEYMTEDQIKRFLAEGGELEYV